MWGKKPGATSWPSSWWNCRHQCECQKIWWRRDACSTIFTSRPAIRIATPKALLLNITVPCRAMRRSDMPVRSLSSSVLTWPDAREVDEAVRRWVDRVVTIHPEVVRVGYFGSYARGDWGVGSDLDLIIIVDRSDEPFERRAARWDATELPVPTDVLVYTRDEWGDLSQGGGFDERVMREAVWMSPHQR